jgi:hypothetical protein
MTNTNAPRVKLIITLGAHIYTALYWRLNEAIEPKIKKEINDFDM